MKLFLLTLFFSILATGHTIVLNDKNMISIDSRIDGLSMSVAKKELQKLVDIRGRGFYTIYIVVRSGGGSLDAGFKFANYAKNIPLVETISIDSFSMASAIVNILPGKRWGTPTCSIGFHEGTLLIESVIPSPYVNRADIERMRQLYEKSFEEFEAANYSRMKISKEEYQSKVNGKDWVVSGNAAVLANAIDEIADVVCDNSLKNKKVTRLIDTPFGISIPEEMSACPL